MLDVHVDKTVRRTYDVKIVYDDVKNKFYTSTLKTHLLRCVIMLVNYCFMQMEANILRHVLSKQNLLRYKTDLH